MLSSVRRSSRLILAAGLLAGLLAGCGVGGGEAAEQSAVEQPTATATVTETVAVIEESEAPEPLTIAESEDADFWSGMEKAGEDVPEDAKATIADLGRTACVGFDMGKDILDVGTLLNDGGFTIEQSGHILGAAISAYCPQHLDQLERP